MRLREFNPDFQDLSVRTAPRPVSELVFLLNAMEVPTDLHEYFLTYFQQKSDAKKVLFDVVAFATNVLHLGCVRPTHKTIITVHVDNPFKNEIMQGPNIEVRRTIDTQVEWTFYWDDQAWLREALHQGYYGHKLRTTDIDILPIRSQRHHNFYVYKTGRIPY